MGKTISRIIILTLLAMLGIISQSNQQTMANGIVGLVTNFIVVDVEDTSISLRWTPATGSTGTIIRYSNVEFPSSYEGDESAYDDSLYYTTLSGLESGENYYFSAWGYASGHYSEEPATIMVTTTSPATGDSIPYDKPTMPSEVWQDPDASGWSIHPIDDILDYFADPSYTHGGLGIPVNNLIMFLYSFFIALISLIVYIKWRNFFAAWTLLVMLTAFGCAIQAMQWYVLILEFLIGLGVWSIEKSYQ